MKFGKVADPSLVDFSLPNDHPCTRKILKQKGGKKPLDLYIGCAKWNKGDLKGFYPKGTKDELTYYATQFNAIEMNTTFYAMPSVAQVEMWRDKTPKNFKFFPKITNSISHYKRLNEVSDEVTRFVSAVYHFGEKLGMVFLQLHENFSPNEFPKLEKFVREWPREIPLSVEVRHEKWFSDASIFSELTSILEEHNLSNTLVDTAGRRDMLHMRLTCPTAFVRYVGANADSDFSRLEAWVERIKTWQEQGLENLYFFVHQNIEEASPLLSAHFIKHLNEKLNREIAVPKMATPIMPDLFGSSFL